MQIEDESVLILKTTTIKYDELEKFVLAIHSYETLCVLKLPVESGSGDFTKWIERSVISEYLSITFYHRRTNRLGSSKN